MPLKYPNYSAVKNIEFTQYTEQMDTKARVDSRSFSLHLKHYKECDNKLAAMGSVPASVYNMQLGLYDIYTKQNLVIVTR